MIATVFIRDTQKRSEGRYRLGHLVKEVITRIFISGLRLWASAFCAFFAEARIWRHEATLVTASDVRHCFYLDTEDGNCRYPFLQEFQHVLRFFTYLVSNQTQVHFAGAQVLGYSLPERLFVIIRDGLANKFTDHLSSIAVCLSDSCAKILGGPELGPRGVFKHLTDYVSLAFAILSQLHFNECRNRILIDEKQVNSLYECALLRSSNGLLAANEQQTLRESLSEAVT